MKRSRIPQNFKKQVEWVFGSYEMAGVGLANGFQKDAIQNSVGARPSKRWDGFKCSISIVNTSKGEFLVVEDTGTVGLTGKNLSSEEIAELSNNDYKFPPTERLSRFTSMNNSGENAVGGGLYGVGKVVYTVASESYSYYFDSLTSDGKYVANSNETGVVYEYAFEGDSAKEFIFKETGLGPKETVGTRVIITSPKTEIVESIKSGEMTKYIQESFWRIIERMDPNDGIFINGERVNVPEWVYEHSDELLIKNQNYQSGYRIKKFGLKVYNNNINEWEGISYYRKGMKIGEVDLREIPEKIDGKFFGYIEVDEPWEKSLELIEDNVHFGVNRYKKNTNAYQFLKTFANDTFNRYMIDKGYKKDRKSHDDELTRELNEMAKEIMDDLIKQGFEELGKGPKKSGFDLRLKDVCYPIDNSEEVTTHDHIKFGIKISNDYLITHKFNINVLIKSCDTGNILNIIEKESVSVKANDTYEKYYDFEIKENVADKYQKNKIIIIVDLHGSQKSLTKELTFYYDCKKEIDTREKVTMTLHSIELPREKKLRINFGEEIKNITYRIDNKANDTLKYRLNISIHTAIGKTMEKVVDVATINGEVPPYETSITDAVIFLIKEEDFKKYITEGEIELRARLSVREETALFEAGTYATKYFYKLYLNKDEKKGSSGVPVLSFDDVEHPEMRSRCETGANRKIIINTGHPDYKFFSDDLKFHRVYLKNELEKQILVLYLEEGKVSSFGDGFDEMTSKDGAIYVLRKIEETHFKNIS